MTSFKQFLFKFLSISFSELRAFASLGFCYGPHSSSLKLLSLRCTNCGRQVSFSWLLLALDFMSYFGSSWTSNTIIQHFLHCFIHSTSSEWFLWSGVLHFRTFYKYVLHSYKTTWTDKVAGFVSWLEFLTNCSCLHHAMSLRFLPPFMSQSPLKIKGVLAFLGNRNYSVLRWNCFIDYLHILVMVHSELEIFYL